MRAYRPWRRAVLCGLLAAGSLWLTGAGAQTPMQSDAGERPAAPVAAPSSDEGDDSVIPLTAPVQSAIPGAHLAGGGLLRFFGFHIYHAYFWVGPAGYNPAAPLAAPFALEIHYSRHFTSKQIARTSVDEWERLGYGNDATRERWHQELLTMIPDVERGQNLTAVYVPGAGMTLFSNGVQVGSEPDPEFCRAFFAIWLDERTRAPELREKLLAHAAPG